MKLSSILAIVAGSSVISALVTIAVETLRRRFASQRHDDHLAMKIAFLVEDYAIDCAHALADHDTAIQSSGAAGKHLGSPPKMASLPDDDYSSFEQNLLAKLLDFPQRVRMAVDEVEFDFGVVGQESAQETAYKRTVELAQLALSIGDSLRAKYKLPRRDLVYGQFSIRKMIADESKKLLDSNDDQT